MTTIFDFQPSSQQAFQFQPTLDGQVYNVIVTWNLYGRYYVNIYGLGNNWIVTLPLLGSPSGINIQSLTWSNGAVEVVSVVPHGFAVGATVGLTVSGAAPSAYDGFYSMLATSPTTLAYDLPADPGAATALGTVSYGISLTAGYFNSTLIFREAAQQFEVSP